jgi:excisionase family DNA binding protein
MRKKNKMTNYLTIRQACAALQVSRNTLLAMIEDGRVKAINLKRPGGKYDVWRIDINVTQTDELVLARRIKLREIERKMGL